MEHSPNDPLEDPFAGADEQASPSPLRALVPTTRHDGFTPERRRLFKQTLRETGCVRDACRVAGISDSAAYRARKREPEFAADWASALALAGGDLEILAWQRAVEGVEEEVWAYGKLVGTRRKRDERLFRLLLQAADPNRHGGPALRSAAAIERRVRAEIEQEQRVREGGSEEHEALREKLARKIERLRLRQEEAMLAAGSHFRDSEGRLIPAGYVWRGDERTGSGAGRTGSGAGRTMRGAERTGSGVGQACSEPAAPPPAARADEQKPPDSAENAPPGPRICGL